MTLFFPKIKEIYQGWASTLLLLRLQWHSLSSKKTRFILIGLLSIVFFMLLAVSQTGQMIRFIASDPQNGVAQQYALMYLKSFTRGELGAIGAGALGLCVLSAILSPFTGSTSTSLFPPQDLSGMSITKWHRFSDSVIAQLSSSIAILQLLTLTALASLLTINGGRVEGLFFTWGTWFILSGLSVLSLWISNFIVQKFGSKTRSIIFGSLILAVILGIVIDPHHGSTVFGIGTLYVSLIQGIGQLTLSQKIIHFILLAIIIIVINYISAIFAVQSINNVNDTIKNTGYSNKRAIKVPGNTLISMILRTIIRSPEIRKPLISGIFIGIFISSILPHTQSVSSVLTVVAPLVVALAWGSNALAHFGGGAIWLASLPQAINKLPWVIFITQIVISLTMFIIIWIPGILLGKTTISGFFMGFIAICCSSIVIARSATHKSIHSPTRTHFGSRSDSTLSPGRALNYTLRMSLWGGQLGVLLLTLNNIKIMTVILLAVICWSIARMNRLQSYWNTPTVRARALHAVITE